MLQKHYHYRNSKSIFWKTFLSFDLGNDDVKSELVLCEVTRRRVPTYLLRLRHVDVDVDLVHEEIE